MKSSSQLFAALTALASPFAWALSPGDVTFVGYQSSGSDAFSFVTWVELAPNESLLFIDAEYDGSGDGSGEGIGGGYYVSSREVEWENTTGSPIAPGTVIIVDGLSNSSANTSLGSVSGGFGLNLNGEQFFIAQGSIANDNGNDYLDGNLLFGLDYEGTGTWGQSNESELPDALNMANGNLSFGGQQALEFSLARDGSPLANYRSLISNPNNWLSFTGTLSAESFTTSSNPPVVIDDRLGAVQGGLLFHPKRLNNALPIIDEAWMLSQGATAIEADNINGADCIRLPDWLPLSERADPSAVYYLYFADHNGNYIRMAWAANLAGPWTGYRMDASLFPIADRGVLSLGSDDENNIGNDIVVDGHVASPQVFIDDANQEFLMYYHGPTTQDGEDRGQSTLVATSSNGLNFNEPSAGGQSGHGSLPVILGESYFRIFEQAGRFYAFSNTGDLWAAPAGEDPLVPPTNHDPRDNYWDRGPNIFTSLRQSRGWPTIRPRHFGVYKRDNVLYAFLTYKEGTPERVRVATFDFDALPADHEQWTFLFPEQEVLRAEEDWEGANFLPLASKSGSKDDGVNQLRDPGVFEDVDGRVYLFYSGQGEDAIGLAQLVTHPQVSGTTEVTTGKDETFNITTDIDVTPEFLRISLSEPTDLLYEAEGATNPLIYDGNNSYSFIQSSTVQSGTASYQLAHLSESDDETLTFPTRYYARPGAQISFESRLAASTNGQLAELQVSFDDVLWQTIWQRVGGTNETNFNPINLALNDLEGRIFSLRFRYSHQNLTNSFFISGAAAGQGWFLDEIVGEALENVTPLAEGPFTASSFTLDDIAPVLSPHLSWSEELEDRFLLSVNGLHDGESTGYGKPFVIRVRSSYEDFLATYFDESEQADPLISGLDADPEGDGLTNLMEHAFGTDPDIVDHCVTEFGMTPGATPAPFLSFNWNPDASVRYFLQMSPDLNSFDDISTLESSSPAGSLLNIVLEPAAGVPLGEQAFFRLRIEAQ